MLSTMERKMERRKALPGLIDSDKEYKRLRKEASALMNIPEERMSPEEGRLLGLLAHLLQEYELKKFPIRNLLPHKKLTALMKDHGLKQRICWTFLVRAALRLKYVLANGPLVKLRQRSTSKSFHRFATLTGGYSLKPSTTAKNHVSSSHDLLRFETSLSFLQKM